MSRPFFTSAPVDPAITIVQNRLHQDPILPPQDIMSISQIITLLEFSPSKIPTSSSRGHILNRSMVQAWVPPLVPSMLTCSWKSLKLRPPPPIYVDNTFVIQQADNNHQFLQHINCMDTHIQFTMDDPKEDGSIPFLDTLISSGPNNTITTMCLHWECNHNFQLNTAYTTLWHVG